MRARACVCLLAAAAEKAEAGAAGESVQMIRHIRWVLLARVALNGDLFVERARARAKWMAQTKRNRICCGRAGNGQEQCRNRTEGRRNACRPHWTLGTQQQFTAFGSVRSLARRLTAMLCYISHPSAEKVARSNTEAMWKMGRALWQQS